MKTLSHTRGIDPKALRPEDYFISLLEQAEETGLLCPAEADRLRQECLLLLEKRCAECCPGSSSIPVARAQELLISICYTVGVALKVAPSPEAALTMLRESGIQPLYCAGMVRIQHKIEAARTLHRRLKRELCVLPNEFYRPTAVEGIEGFFKLYRPEFSAQETHITADYPTLLPIERCTGIEFIEQYVRNLYCENRFFRAFPLQTICSLLEHIEGYRPQLMMALCEPVLAAALACALTGRSVRSLRWDHAALERMLMSGTTAQTEQLLRRAWKQAGAALELPQSVRHYLEACLPPLAARLRHAAVNGGLDGLMGTGAA